MIARYIDFNAIDNIALGSSLLATGGGGDPYLGSLLAKNALRKSLPVPIVSLADVTDQMMMTPISGIGSPITCQEKIFSTRQILQSFEMMEKVLQTKLDATFPIEVGGINSLIPFIVAAYKGIPVIDCDATGRAFPESQMVTFFLDGLPSTPNTMADEKGNVVVLHPIDGLWAERFARDITTQMGASTIICDYPMRGQQLKRSAIGGTLTLAENIGKTLREAQRSGSCALSTLLDIVQGYHIAAGKIIDIARTTTGGFTKGKLILEGLGQHKGEQFAILFQNEFLLAHHIDSTNSPTSNNLLAVTPDLISVLDSTTSNPITTEQLRYGQRVNVIAYPCHEKWRTPRGIEVVGPAYFGYPVAYRPIELFAQR